MYSNVDQLTIDKKVEIENLINSCSPDAIVLTEIHPKSGCPLSDAELHINNFDIFYNDNPKRGVAIYVSKHLHATRLNLTSTFNEYVFCQLTTANGESCAIGGIYRSGSSSLENNDKLFELISNATLKTYDHLLMVGDFNYPHAKWDGSYSTHSDHNIVRELQDNLLFQMVNQPTRHRIGQQSNILDLVIVNSPEDIQTVQHFNPIGRSDHELLSVKTTISKHKEKPQNNPDGLYFPKANYEKMANELNNIPWSSVSDKDSNYQWNFFKDKLLDSMKKNIPKKKQCKYPKKYSWMDKKCSSLIKKKKKCYNEYLSLKTRHSLLKYNRVRNEAKSYMTKSRRMYEANIAKNSKLNPKPFWRYVKQSSKATTGIATLKIGNNHPITTDKDKARTLNNFFSSVFCEEEIDSVPNLAPNSYSDNTSALPNITKDCIAQKIMQLNEDKACGPDDIPVSVLKNLVSVITQPLYNIFIKSLDSSVIPQDWKHARVTAIYKKGSKSDPGNYRPVSLTSIVCKLFESFVRDSIDSHMASNNLYTDSQHGFRQSKSCSTQLLEVMDHFSSFINEHQSYDVVYLDFQKAFDTVPHERLITKLLAYGIHPKIVCWIRSFLSNRTQVVKVNQEESHIAHVTSGIPQGSILGPTLFNVFINDITCNISSYIKVFADDTKIYNLSKNHEILQQDLFKLNEWSKKWCLFFNANKCKVIHYGGNNPNHKYLLSPSSTSHLTEDCEEKDLGVIFDNNLSFDKHINAKICKANQIHGVLKRNLLNPDPDTVIDLYKTLIRPHLEYANSIWSPRYKRQSIAIEKVQRRITKSIYLLKDLPYTDRLKELNLPSLKYRRLRGDLIQCYKYVYNIDKFKLNSLQLYENSHNTRGHQYKLKVNHKRTLTETNSFANRVINPWNALPSNTVLASSLNLFKESIDNFYGDFKYEYDE